MGYDQRLTDDVLHLLVATYQLPTGEEFKGQSISYLSQELRDLGWKGVSRLNNLESKLEELGFRIVPRAQSRNGGGRLSAPARVVTV